jgi:hypothetical protein
MKAPMFLAHFGNLLVATAPPDYYDDDDDDVDGNVTTGKNAELRNNPAMHNMLKNHVHRHGQKVRSI